MSYIDDILGGVISEGETLVRGYVNDALDPIGELIIDGMQAIGLLDSLESEWQKFEREELANYKGSFSPEVLKSRYQDVLSERLEQYAAEKPDASPSLNTPWRDKHINERIQKFKDSNGEDAQGIFSLSRPLPGVSLRPRWRHQLPPGSSFESDNYQTVLMQRQRESEFFTSKLKGMTYESRKFLENLDAKSLVSTPLEGYRHNHKLELMGKLDFSYPESSLKDRDLNEGSVDKIHRDGQDFYVFPLPFFENPKISESRAATYSTNDIVNRNEPYKVWMGAKGKQVNLSFKISMTHLMSFATQQIADLNSRSVHDTQMQEKILEQLRQQNDYKSNSVPGSETSETVNTSPDTAFDIYSQTNKILNNPSLHSLGLADTQSTRAKIIVYTVYLLDMIRSSVIGSTKYPEVPRHGKRLNHPPVTFLTFGALYHQEPFIVKSYDLDFDGKHGYEELSLLPRTITVKLKLESYDQLQESQVVQGISKRYQLGN